MYNKITDFYSGYEGEGEIQFITFINNEKVIIKLWDGYFDDIMKKIEPTTKGWTSLAHHYNLATGWYDESPWKLKNIVEALKQLKEVMNAEFEFEGTKGIYNEICALLANAIETNNSVYIAYE